jgi:phosphomannomutase
VVIEVRTSSIVRDWVEKAGGSVEVTTCWTIPIKLKMKSDPEIVFGGETSGHYMFPAIHETDDGVFSALTFLQAISSKEESVDDIIEKFRKKYYVIDETNFKMEDMDGANAILEKLKNKFATEGARIVEIDGVSAIFPDWWFNLRKSESEPVIRLNLEANSKELMEEKTEEITRFIEENK